MNQTPYSSQKEIPKQEYCVFSGVNLVSVFPDFEEAFAYAMTIPNGRVVNPDPNRASAKDALDKLIVLRAEEKNHTSTLKP